MIAKLSRIAVAGLVLAALSEVPSAFCDIWNPFSSDKSTQSSAKPKNTSAKSAQTPPSMFDKIASAPKNAWNAMTGKKAEPERRRNAGVAYPKNPYVTQQKETSNSWIPWPKAEEKKTPTSVQKWMKTSKRPELESE